MMPSDNKKWSRLIWGAAIFLLAAAFIIPNVDFSLQVDSPRADATPDPFDERVVDFEKRFDRGDVDEVDADEALQYAPYLKARSLTDAGPMTAGQIIRIVDEIEEFQSQIAEQPTAASRAALRSHRNEVILEELPRLDEERAVEALDEVRGRYIEVFEVDPASGLDTAP